jgi:C4-dicarboxylate-binding protein DctP
MIMPRPTRPAACAAAIRGALVLIPLLFLLASCDRVDGDRPVTIRFVHVTAPATPKGQGAEMFRRLAEERFPGRVRVEVYPSGQLMNDDDSLEALVFGEIQMVATSLSKFDRMTKRYQVFDLPFLFEDLDAVERFQASPIGRQLLREELRDKGFLGLGYWHNGMKQLGATRELRLPEAARGLKFRIQESDVLQAQVQQLGGNPQKMAFSEVYHALQTGAVDAQENTWSNMYSQKFYEVQPYLTESNHGYLGYLFATNPTFWESLPDDLREGLEQVADEVTAWVNAEGATINDDARELIARSGRSSIIELSEEERAAWREAMTPVWARFEAEIGTEILQAARSAGADPATAASLPRQ